MAILVIFGACLIWLTLAHDDELMNKTTAQATLFLLAVSLAMIAVGLWF